MKDYKKFTHLQHSWRNTFPRSHTILFHKCFITLNIINFYYFSVQFSNKYSNINQIQRYFEYCFRTTRKLDTSENVSCLAFNFHVIKIEFYCCQDFPPSGSHVVWAGGRGEIASSSAAQTATLAIPPDQRKVLTNFLPPLYN